MEKWHRVLHWLMLFLAGVIVGILVLRYVGPRRRASPSPSPSAPVTSQYGSIADFSLTDRSGKKVRPSDLMGSYWVADFVFTRCMGPCPLLTTHMARLGSEFPRSDLKFVSITVDPEFDTPAVLKKYAESYGADPQRWYFLSGDKNEIFELIQKSFHLAVEPDEKDPMQVVHSLSFVLVGKKGEILGYYNATDPEALQSLREKLATLS